MTDNAPLKPLAVDGDATVRALQTGLASTAMAVPLLALTMPLGAGLLGIGAAVAGPVVAGAVGAFLGYRLGLHHAEGD